MFHVEHYCKFCGWNTSNVFGGELRGFSKEVGRGQSRRSRETNDFRAPTNRRSVPRGTFCIGAGIFHWLPTFAFVWLANLGYCCCYFVSVPLFSKLIRAQSSYCSLGFRAALKRTRAFDRGIVNGSRHWKVGSKVLA